MVISPLMLLLILVILLAFSGAGYGYYRGGAYANPMGVIGTLLIVGLIFWLLFGGGFILTPPPGP